MNKTVPKPLQEVHVLMVEDNADHAFLTAEAFRESGHQVSLHHVTDGERCLAFLRRQPPHENAPWPDLILLDMHMPRMNGYEVVLALAQDEALRRIPVVVLTTSSEALDVARMYQAGCNSYVVKRNNFDEFTAVIKQLSDYWFNLVIRPAPRD